MRIPVATITVDDPRGLQAATSNGYGYGMDHPYEQGGGQWRYSGVEYLPSLKAIAPAGRAPRADMSLGDWQVETGQWDDKARPALSPRTRFLHCYGSATAGAANVSGTVTSHGNWRPQLCAWIYRHVAPADSTTAARYLSLRLNGDGINPLWEIVLPAAGSDRHPYLVRYEAAGLPGRVVSVYEEDVPSEQDSGWHIYVLWVELTLTQWMIGLSVDGKAAQKPWTYQPPGVDIAGTTVLCGSGTLTFKTQGQQAYFAAAPIKYPLYSEAYFKAYHAVDARFGSCARPGSPLTADVAAICPAGTQCMADVETDADPNSYGLRVGFSGPETKRAVAGLVGARLPQLVGAAASDPWSSTGKQLVGSITYTRRSTWKGSDISATYRDGTGAIDWQPNSVVQLTAGLQTVAGTPPTMTALVTGYLQEPEESKPGSKPLLVSVRATDFAGSRMKHHTMFRTRSFGGFLFEKAFREIGNVLGLLDANVLVHSDLSALYLSTPQVIGEPAFGYGDDDSPERALDDICGAVGAVWGFDGSGRLFADPAPAYSAGVSTIAYTLDHDATDAGDVIEHVVRRRSLDGYANNVFTVCSSEGWQTWGWAQDADSIATSSAEDFVGDYVTEVETYERRWCNANTVAAATLARKQMAGDVLTWSPVECHPEVEPGSYCKADLNAVLPSVPTNAVYMVIEERGEFRPSVPNGMGWKQIFEMVRVA